MLITKIDRQIIIHYYKQAESKSGFWKWKNKPITVSAYELMVAKRDLNRALTRSRLFRLIDKFDRLLSGL